MWSKVMGAAAAGMCLAAFLVLNHRDDYLPTAGVNAFWAAECLRRAWSYLGPRPVRVPHALALLVSCFVVAVMSVDGAAHYRSSNDSWNLMRGILPVMVGLAGVGAYLAGWLVTRLLFKRLEPAHQRLFSQGVLLLFLTLSAALLARSIMTLWESRAHRADQGATVLRWTFMQADEQTRLSVARNPAAPFDLIRDVAWQTAANPKDEFIHEAACANTVLHLEEIQRLLAAGPSLACKRGLADNPNTSAELLKRLADEPALWWHLAFNPRTPPEVLLRMFSAPNLRAAVLETPGPPYRVVMGRLDERHIPASTLHLLASDERAPEELLAILAKNGLPQVRKSVVGNPRTPRDAVEKLAQDSNPEVQALARQRLQREQEVP
jgi:hypothetical protein